MQDGLIVVEAEWDSEAGVYVAESQDVPGLVTEASDQKSLSNKLQVMIPELLEASGIGIDLDHLSFKIVFRTIEVARMRA